MPRKVLDMSAAYDRLFCQGNQSRTAAGFASVALKTYAAGGSCQEHRGINRRSRLPVRNSDAPYIPESTIPPDFFAVFLPTQTTEEPIIHMFGLSDFLLPKRCRAIVIDFVFVYGIPLISVVMKV